LHNEVSLNIIQPENNLTEKLDGLFTKYSNVDPNALGMKKIGKMNHCGHTKILRKVEIEN
jgi:hypothetical protein